jgi:hypothetical protein
MLIEHGFLGPDACASEKIPNTFKFFYLTLEWPQLAEFQDDAV